MSLVMEKIMFVSFIYLLFQLNLSAQDFWQQLPQPHPPVVFSFAFSINGYIYVGSNISGFYRSTDNAASWQIVFGDRYSFDIIINQFDYIFVSGARGYFRSSDYGENWTEITQMNNHSVYCSAINSNNVLYAGTNDGKIFRTSDNGNNWTEVSNGLPGISMHCLSINPNNNIYAGTWGGGVYRSTNGGQNWVAINLGLDIQNVGDISSFVSNSNDYVFVCGDSKFFRSTNSGENWVDISNSVNSSLIITLTINTNKQIFAGGGSGVFCSTDLGNTWSDLNSGLDTNYTIIGLDLDLTEKIYASNGYLYRSIHSTTSIVNEPNFFPLNFLLTQNYPNPFNPTTTVSYQIPERGFVSLKIYDILGREVVTLVNEEKPVGSYEVQFNGTSLTSGIYFYQLSTGNYTDTKKMILLR